MSNVFFSVGVLPPTTPSIADNASFLFRHGSLPSQETKNKNKAEYEGDGLDAYRNRWKVLVGGKSGRKSLDIVQVVDVPQAFFFSFPAGDYWKKPTHSKVGAIEGPRKFGSVKSAKYPALCPLIASYTDKLLQEHS